MWRFRIGYLLLYFLLWCLPNTSFAQVDINFTAITTKDGLPSNTVLSILKDKYGLMWFGTSNGLCKFDGINFSVYRHEPGNAYTLPGNEVLCLYEDRAGKLWIGSGAGGLSYYDRTKDRIIRYLADGSWPAINHISPRAIVQDHEGKLWVATYGGVWTVDPVNGKTSNIKLLGKSQQVTDSFVGLSLFEDSKNQMWIGTNKGLFVYNIAKKSVTGFVNNPGDANSLSSNVIKSITGDRNGNIWIGTLGGLNQLLPNGHFKTYRHQNDVYNSLSSDAVFIIKPDKDGKLWIGTENGVNIFDPATATFRVIQPDPRNALSLKSPSIRSLFIDTDGIYWVGTFGAGLAKYDKNLPLFNLKQSDPFDQSGLRSPIVDAFAEYNSSTIFVGTDGGGLQTFNRNTGLFRSVKINSRLRKPGSGLTVWNLCFDRTGNLWAGTYHDGLFRINPVTGDYEQFTADKKAGSLNSNDITSLMEDSQGNIWIGTLGGGVNILKAGNNNFLKFEQVFNQSLSLNDFISSIIKSPRGEIWIASAGAGVTVFNPVTNKVKHYTKAQNHLADDVVEHLFFDSDGMLWLSTQGGLCRLDEKTNRITTYTEKDGLANVMVKSILEDNSGLLWITSDRGISSFDKHTGKFQNFNETNGVQQGAFSTNAGIKLSNGDIYFGGRDGFNYFTPANMQHRSSPGLVLLTDLKVSNESVKPGDNAPIKEQIAVAKEIKLKYGLNFSISYAALNYTSPRQNQFAYRLLGFDKDWNYVHKGRVANYTNIDPGTYTFQVKASNDGEHWSSPPTGIKIVVFPPLWRTIYAYIFYVLLAGLFLFLLRRRGIQKIRKEFEDQQKKARFEHLIEQQRREAKQLHELDLLKIKFLTDLSHEFRTPISLILAPVDKLLQQKTTGEEQEYIRMISRNAKRLLNMVNQLLDFRKMEEQELSLNLEPGDIIGFIRETGDSFKDVAAKKHVNFVISTPPPHHKVFFDPNKIERIIFNLLSNAFKFTPSGGNVTLSAEITNSQDDLPSLNIRVSDTGIGIPAKDIAKIFDRFFQHQTNAVINQGTGIGLSITKEFVELHGGQIYAESVTEKGTSFIINLPVTIVAEDITETAAEVFELSEDLNNTEATEAELAEDSVAGDETDTIAAEGKTTILLVEDNDEFRTYLAGHLRKYYHIIEAANGKEGWQKTLNAHPQLIVSDINMPFMTGIELSTKIKGDKRTCHIPVILLTALIGEEEQLKGLRSGATDYLSKTFNFQILHTKIENMLNLNKSVKNTYSKQIQLTGQEIVTESGNLKLLNTILKYIEDKLSDSDLSVEDLSKHVGMSRGSLYYKLIELTGLSPIEYIRTVKLEKAAALMETSELNIAQIAYLTGFGTPSYFTRMFKSKYGMVPSEYLNAKRASAKNNHIPLN